MASRCYIVPPHIFQALCESSEVTDEVRQVARSTLDHRQHFVAPRRTRLQTLAQPRGYVKTRPSIVPATILSNLADSDDIDEETRACAKRDLEHLLLVHGRIHNIELGEISGAKQAVGDTTEHSLKIPTKAYRSIYDSQHSQDEFKLPGKLLRKEGQKTVKDDAANQAYDNVGDVIKMYADVFKWKSIDNQNMPVVSSVHFGKSYENAFWDPEASQMVFGDGGEFLGDFTASLDVIGHEMTHAVTEHTAPLDYSGQSGALNESISDCFGIMIKQWVDKETSEDADWLIGEGCLLPGVKGVALRSMKAPGTAYDDARFGKDPQPDNFQDFKIMAEDNGGVHIYSGIPNKAFYLCSIAFGGHSWEKAGQIWWKTMNSGRIPPQCTFLEFANATVFIAKQEFGDEAAKIVRDAWNEVGVTKTPRGGDGDDDGGEEDSDDEAALAAAAADRRMRS